MAAADHRIVLEVVEMSVSVDLLQIQILFYSQIIRFTLCSKYAKLFREFTYLRTYGWSMMDSNLKVGKY